VYHLHIIMNQHLHITIRCLWHGAPEGNRTIKSLKLRYLYHVRNVYDNILRHKLSVPALLGLNWHITFGPHKPANLTCYILLCHINYLLTPLSRVLLEKLTGSQLVKKFPAFYRTRRFITAFTSARHLTLSYKDQSRGTCICFVTRPFSMLRGC
jgi:hypothetical protein